MRHRLWKQAVPRQEHQDKVVGSRGTPRGS